MFFLTHQSNGFGGFTRIEWPDGRALIEQPEILIQAMKIVELSVLKNQESGKHG